MRKERNGFGDPAWREIVKLAGRQPYLTKDEERALFTEVQRTNDVALRKKIGLIYLRPVVQIAAYYYKRNTGAEIMAFVQAGCSGLMESINKFKPASGNRFVTCAWWWIRIRVQHEISLHNSVVTIKHGGDTNDLVSRRTVSMTSLHEDPDLNVQAVEEILRENVPGSDLRQSPEQFVYDNEIRTEIRTMVASLCHNSMERTIAMERIFEEKPSQATALEIIGNRHGCSREHVRQMQKQITGRLKRRVEEKDLIAA